MANGDNHQVAVPVVHAPAVDSRGRLTQANAAIMTDAIATLNDLVERASMLEFFTGVNFFDAEQLASVNMAIGDFHKVAKIQTQAPLVQPQSAVLTQPNRQILDDMIRTINDLSNRVKILEYTTGLLSLP